MQHCVYLIDSDTAIQEMLGRILNGAGWQYEGYDSFSQFYRHHPQLNDLSGCLLFDVHYPGDNALLPLAAWRARGLTLPVVIISRHASIRLCRQAFRGGAFDFLLKPLDPALVLEAVAGALAYHRQGVEQRQKHRDLRHKLARLTPREQQVLAQIMRGQASKEIARTLILSPRTVEAHRASIFDKLEVNSVAKLLTRYAAIYLRSPGVQDVI
ncbi:response regulator transcription factor [Shimwellia pseudoproteus]|uniref:response regulator transcription factor n=1 Tax=Shimwellia pseudoproteus TaxID=570012 RepID=UPI0018EC739A|nr:LuxR C-terminal-related transcriptional regulator [Shimwellia pseudoproteus]MBJ3816142.1 response regulator transcription factor [Shimwellia pseudoproteus]